MKSAGLGIVGLVALGIVFALPSYAYNRMTAENVQITVSSKDRECKNEKDCRYVIYTTEEVFENRDSWWYLKFNSSDLYNKLVPGQTYNVTVTGWRIPFFSMYRNIVELK